MSRRPRIHSNPAPESSDEEFESSSDDLEFSEDGYLLNGELLPNRVLDDRLDTPIPAAGVLERGLNSSSSSEESETDFEDNGQQFQGEEPEAEELPLNNLFGQQVLGIAPNQEPHARQELGNDAPPPPLPNHPFDQEPLGVTAAIAQEDAPKEFGSESKNPGSSCLSSESFPLQETEKSQHK